MRQPQDSNCWSVVSRRDQREDGDGEEVARRRAGLRPGGPIPASLRRAVLGGHQHRPAPLATEGEALHQPEQDQQDRRPDADRRVGRQQADQEGRATHHHQRDDQHLLAADLVAEVPEDHPTDRPGGEADGIRGEREQRADERVEVGEEQLVEDQRGGRAVEEEVVPLHGGPDEAGTDDLHDGRARPGRDGGFLVGPGQGSFPFTRSGASTIPMFCDRPEPPGDRGARPPTGGPLRDPGQVRCAVGVACVAGGSGRRQIAACAARLAGASGGALEPAASTGDCASAMVTHLSPGVRIASLGSRVCAHRRTSGVPDPLSPDVRAHDRWAWWLPCRRCPGPSRSAGRTEPTGGQPGWVELRGLEPPTCTAGQALARQAVAPARRGRQTVAGPSA